MESATLFRTPVVYWDMLEVYRIRVDGVSRDRDFSTIYVGSEDVIYRRKDGESVARGQELLFSSPKQPFDLLNITIGNFDWGWFHEFDRRMPQNEIKSFTVTDPQYTDASVTILCEWISKAVQAHIEVTYSDDGGDDEESLISISHGEISAISGDSQVTKRLLLSVKDGEEHDVQRNKPIPLHRSVVASRLRSNLVVDVNLKVPITGQLTFTTPRLHHEVYNEHDKQVAPTSSQIIMESAQKFKGRVKVKVSWYNDLTPYDASDSEEWDQTDTVCSVEEDILEYIREILGMSKQLRYDACHI